MILSVPTMKLTERNIERVVFAPPSCAFGTPFLTPQNPLLSAIGPALGAVLGPFHSSL
jgi:hypothetical protein